MSALKTRRRVNYRTGAANMLFHVVNDRHRKKRAMIFTTNKPLTGNPATRTSTSTCRKVPHARRDLCRVSTFDQDPEKQLAELRRYTAARDWTASNTRISALAAPRTDAQHWTNSSRMPGGADSMSSCAGASIGWGGIFAT